MIACPRCQSDKTRLEHKGKEGGKTVWTLYYCLTCCFGWRDTEPERSIRHEARDSFFRVDTDKPEQYPIAVPPLR